MSFYNNITEYIDNVVEDVNILPGISNKYLNFIDLLSNKGLQASKVLNVQFNNVVSLLTKYMFIPSSSANILSGLKESATAGKIELDCALDSSEEEYLNRKMNLIAKVLDSVVKSGGIYDDMADFYYSVFPGQQDVYHCYIRCGSADDYPLYLHVDLSCDETYTPESIGVLFWINNSIDDDYQNVDEVGCFCITPNETGYSRVINDLYPEKYPDLNVIQVINADVKSYFNYDRVVNALDDTDSVISVLVDIGELLRKDEHVDASTIANLINVHMPLCNGSLSAWVKEELLRLKECRIVDFIALSSRVLPNITNASSGKNEFFSTPVFIKQILTIVLNVITSILSILVFVLKGIFQAIAAIVLAIAQVFSFVTNKLTEVQLDVADVDEETAYVNYPIGSFTGVTSITTQSSRWESVDNKYVRANVVNDTSSILDSVVDYGYPCVDCGFFGISIFPVNPDDAESSIKNGQIWVKACDTLSENYYNISQLSLLQQGSFAWVRQPGVCGVILDNSDLDASQFSVIKFAAYDQADYPTLIAHNVGLALWSCLAIDERYAPLDPNNKNIINCNTVIGDEGVSLIISNAISTGVSGDWVSRTVNDIYSAYQSKSSSEYYQNIQRTCDAVAAILTLCGEVDDVRSQRFNISMGELQTILPIVNTIFSAWMASYWSSATPVISAKALSFTLASRYLPGKVKLPILNARALWIAIGITVAATLAFAVIRGVVSKRLKIRATAAIPKREEDLNFAREFYNEAVSQNDKEAKAYAEKLIYKANRKLTRAWKWAGIFGVSMYNGFDTGSSDVKSVSSAIDAANDYSTYISTIGQYANDSLVVRSLNGSSDNQDEKEVTLKDIASLISG